MPRVHNSARLFQDNQRLYRDFLANYPLVVSSPGGVILTGALSHQIGGIGIHHKIPLRNYLGIRLSDGEGVGLRHYGTFNVHTNTFEALPIEGELQQKIEYFHSKLQQKLGKTVRLDIGILNEIPRRTGLNNPGTAAANFATSFLLLVHQCSLDTLGEYQRGDEGIGSDEREMIIDTVKEFHTQWMGPNSSGFGALGSMRECQTPVVYQANERTTVTSLSDLFGFSDNQPYPVDLTIIGTADRNNIDFSIRSYDELPELLDISSTDLLQAEQRGMKFPPAARKNPLAYLVGAYRQAMEASTMACLFSLGRYFADNSLAHQDNCLNSFNNDFRLTSLFGRGFARKNLVREYVRDYFRHNLPDVPYAVVTSVANHLVLVTSYEHLRPHLDGLASYLTKELDFEISFPYVSWRDGLELEGLRVEQWVDQHIYSSKMLASDLVLRTIVYDAEKQEVVSVNSREDAKNLVDLLIDQDENRIYIRGTRVDSKKLPTVSATIKLFMALLKSPNHTVDSKNLPSLSYFQDRNELQSKIITPLRHLTDKTLNKSISIKISGGLQEFTVSYSSSELSLGMLCPHGLDSLK